MSIVSNKPSTGTGIGYPLLAASGLLYAVTGYCTTYSYGYRNDAFFEAVAIAAAASAALILTSLLLGNRYISKKMKGFRQQEKGGNNAWLLLAVLPVLLFIAGYIFLSIKGVDDAAKIIETALSATTIAIVKDVRPYDTSGRYARNREHDDLLLEYSVNGKTFYRILDNTNSRYSKGAQLELQYVIADPYLARVLK